MFPQFDFLMLVYQLSGHGKMRKGTLNVNNMSVKYGGKQEIMRNTTIKEIDPYHGILNVGDEQRMVFADQDD